MKSGPLCALLWRILTWMVWPSLDSLSATTFSRPGMCRALRVTCFLVHQVNRFRQRKRCYDITLSRQEGSTMHHHASAPYWTGLAGGYTGSLFLMFAGPVCTDWISNCPLDRVLTYKNLIYLLNLQIWSYQQKLSFFCNDPHIVFYVISGQTFSSPHMLPTAEFKAIIPEVATN